MATYYASNSGSSGAGTLGSPWGIPDLFTANPSNTTSSSYVAGVALTTLAAGDTLYFMGGTYSLTGDGYTGDYYVPMIAPTVNGTAGNPITFQSYPGQIAYFTVTNTTSQPVFGTSYPNATNYIRFIALKVEMPPWNNTTQLGSAAAFYVQGNDATSGGLYNEIGYCEVVGTDAGTLTDNHDGIRLNSTDGAWIHHCYIHGVTASGTSGSSGANSSGIKLYSNINTLIEDNEITDCASGVHDKQPGYPFSSATPSNTTYRRNWFYGNVLYNFLGINNPGVSSYFIYDNVFDELGITIATPGVGTNQSLNSQVYNNLLRGLTSGYPAFYDSASESYLDNIWNNVVFNNGSAIVSYECDYQAFSEGTSTSPIANMDYNFYDLAPTYTFGNDISALTIFSFNGSSPTIQSEGFEVHSAVESQTTIYVDTTSYVLQTAYQAAGLVITLVGAGNGTATTGTTGGNVGPRSSSPVGPSNIPRSNSVAQIINTGRYGPAGMPPMGFAYVNSAITDRTGTSSTTTTVSLTGVTAGHLLRVAMSGSGFPDTLVLTDGHGTTYNLINFTNHSGNMLGEWFGYATASGSITWTITTDVSVDIDLGVVEYSFAGSSPGAIYTELVQNSGSGTALSTGNVTFSGAGSWMVCGTFGANAGTTWTAGSGYTLRQYNPNPGETGGLSLGLEDFITTASSSPSNATVTLTSSTGSWYALGSAFLEAPSGYTFAASPTTVPQGSTNYALTMTGTDTLWNSLTPWSCSGISGASVASAVIHSATSATVYFNTGSAIGTLTITDGTASITATIIPGTFVAPYVNRSGMMQFIATSVSSGLPVAVTALNSNPTVKVNGNAIALSTNAAWLNQSFQSPAVHYLALCGGVNSVLIQTGGHGYTNGTISVSHSGGGGTGLALGTPTIVNGVITAISASGQSSGPGILEANGGNGTGFVGGYTCATPGTLSNITAFIDAGGSGYPSSGTAISIQSATQAVVGTSFTPTVSNGALSIIPVTNSGSGYTSAPTITVTDSGSGTGAVAAPIMSGPLSTDTVTFSAASGWLTSTAGTIAAATNAAVDNSAGQIEPWFTAVTPTMGIGMNWAYPIGFEGLYTRQQNWLQTANAPWTGAQAPGLTITDGTGSLAIAIGIVNSSGEVTGYTVLCGGTGYTSPSATCAAPASGGTTATCGAITVVGGVITAIALGIGGSGYGACTTDGYPIAINGNTYPQFMSGTPTVPTAWILCSNQALSNNGINPSGLADLAGIWTVTATETAPSTPMSVSLFVAGTETQLTPSPSGTTAKTWLFNASARPPGINANNLGISLIIQGPSAAASAPMTLTNLALYAPNQNGTAITPNLSLPLAPNPNPVRWMSSQVNDGAATAIRFNMFGNYAWDGGSVLASDLRSASDFCWADGPQANVYLAITAIRQYWTQSSGNPGWYSPYIFTQEAYPGTSPSSGLGSGPYPAPYYWTPPAPNGIYIDWIAPCLLGAEFITAAPHGLSTGNRLFIPNNTLTASLPIWDYNAGPTSTSNVDIQSGDSNDAQWVIWVTGFNSFVILFTYTPGGYTPGSHKLNVHGSNAANFVISAPKCQQDYLSTPVEVACNAVNAIPGCGLWVFPQLGITDAAATVLFERVRDAIDVGRKVYIEWIDEHWNNASLDFYPNFTMSTFANGASGIVAGDVNAMYCWRTGTLNNLAIAAFNAMDIHGNTNRGGSIVCMMGGQQGNPFSFPPMITYLNTWNAANPGNQFRVDLFLAAGYWDMPVDSAMAAAAAATFSNFLSSTAYQGTPWTMAQWMDLARATCFFQNAYNVGSDNGWPGESIPFFSTYNLVSGQTSSPKLANYESCVSGLVPPAVSTLNYMLRTYIGHDATLHPFNADMEEAYYAGLQTAGVVLSMMNPLCYGADGQDPGSFQVNGAYDNQASGSNYYARTEAQVAGRGDGSLDNNGNPTVNLFFNAASNAGNTGGGVPQYTYDTTSKLAGFQAWVTAAAGVATSYTLTAPSPDSGNVGTPSNNFTVQADGTPSVALVVTPAVSGITGTFTPASLTISDGSTHTFTFTPSSVGVGTISVTHTGGGFSGDPPNVSYTASATATSYTLTAPSPDSGSVGVASGNFDVQANGTPSVSLVVTPSLSGITGTFSPTNLTITDASVHTFKLTPSSTGVGTISVTHTGGGFSGDPSNVTYTSNALVISFSLSPNASTINAIVTAMATGFHTSWTSETTLILSGGTAAEIISQNVNVVAQTISFTLFTGSTAATLTVSDSTDSATAPFTVVAGGGGAGSLSEEQSAVVSAIWQANKARRKRPVRLTWIG
jgi:hypothetical protein